MLRTDVFFPLFIASGHLKLLLREEGREERERGRDLPHALVHFAKCLQAHTGLTWGQCLGTYCRVQGHLLISISAVFQCTQEQEAAAQAKTRPNHHNWGSRWLHR